MDKNKAKEYLEKKRNNTLFKSDSVIMKEMYNGNTKKNYMILKKLCID